MVRSEIFLSSIMPLVVFRKKVNSQSLRIRIEDVSCTGVCFRTVMCKTYGCDLNL